MESKAINVELGVADDIKTFIKYFEGQFKLVEKEGDQLGTKLGEAIKAQRLFESHIDKLNNEKKQALSSINDFKKMAKDLGINANSPEVSRLQNLINEIDEYAKLANSVGRIPQF